MRTTLIIAFIILVSNINAQDTIKNVGGPHGGILKSVESYKIEMLITYNRIYAYLYNKNVEPIRNKNITGEVVFVYEDNASLNIKLNPYENDGFIADVANPNYSYCTINFNIYGKMITTKFENQPELAKKEKKK